MMTKEDNFKFNVAYSYTMEEMLEIFWHRVDIVINILLIVSGCAVVATLNIDIYIGLFIALLSAINVVISPVRREQQARDSYKRFYEIYSQFDHLSPDDIKERTKDAEARESHEIGAICNLAYNRAAIRLDLTPKALSSWDKCVGFFIGDIPLPRKSL